MDGKIRKAIIIGSAPISRKIGDVNLDGYHKIAINKSWRIRRDFDTHVYLSSLSDDDMPPLASGLNPIGVSKFTPYLNSAGGLYLTSGSVAMISGYWSIANLGLSLLSYYACDLVFPENPDEQTHFYGSGDQGPLLGNFQYNLRQKERSIRLLCWGLMHRVVIANSSALDGSILAFPQMHLHVDSAALIDDILSSKETLRLLRKASNIWAFEYQTRTPEFRRPQRIFEKDPEALGAMNRIMDEWLALEPFVLDYANRVTDLTIAADEVIGAGRGTTPTQYLERKNSPFNLVVHIGSLNGASSILQEYLDTSDIDDAICKIVSKRDLKNYYSKLAALLAKDSSRNSASQRRNIQITQNFAKRLFDRLDIQAGERVLISEGSALGNPAQCAFTGKLFHSSNNVLSNFAANLPVEPSEVHVTISRYSDFFAWAYLEFLNSTRSAKYISPDLMVAKVMANLPSWVSALEGVALCFPSSRITVWCVNDLAVAAPELLAALVTGAPEAELDAPNFSTVSARPTHQAQIDQFMSIINQSGLEVALESWGDICATPSEDITIFNPWTPNQKRHLDLLYDKDLETISSDRRFVLRGCVEKGQTS